MLLKFERVEEIGRFASLQHRAPQFAKLTLIYARNGYGKSTVCAVLRSASDSNPAHINSRKRLGAKSEPHVQTKWASAGDAIFSKGAWSKCPGEILVFDHEFINRNLHIGDDVTRDNKRNLLPVVIGAKGVALSKKVLELDREQRQLDAAIRQNSTIIRAKFPVINDVLSFCQVEVPPDVDNKIDGAEKAMELARHSLAVKQRQLPKFIVVPDLLQLKSLADRTIADVSGDAASRVVNHMSKHGLEPPHGDRWLRYGITHLTAATCPLCDQPVAGLPLIEAYKGYFSEAFSALTAECARFKEELERSRDDLESIISGNTVDFEFWKSVCALPIIPTIADAQASAIREALNLLIELVDKKIANPLTSAMAGFDFDKVKAGMDSVMAYNDALGACIGPIGKAKDDALSADVSKATEIHQKWLALKARSVDPIKEAVEAYKSANSRLSEIEHEKQSAQGALRTYATDAIASRQLEINELLSDFGANFKLVDMKASFVGRDPNTDYAIAIGSDKLVAGQHSDKEPSFKTVLSSGDKGTLALAFFITQVRAHPNLSELVVVFDDPFNSQDLHRQFETSSQIRLIARSSQQTIVLSHDPRFLALIAKHADHETHASFQILCTDNGVGSVSLWSADDELKELYIQRAEAIREYAKRKCLLGKMTCIELIQALRPFLEDYLRARFPGRFKDDQSLYDMASAIQEAGSSDPLCGSVSDILSINEYTRKDQHGGGAHPDADELCAQCKKIDRIIGSY
jgi:wobble nucleotide-excising tRNase